MEGDPLRSDLELLGMRLMGIRPARGRAGAWGGRLARRTLFTDGAVVDYAAGE